MSEPKYIAVDGVTPSIIKHCDDRSCDRYHTWIGLDSRAKFSDAYRIASAMNQAPKVHSESERQQIDAWTQIVNHPFFEACFSSSLPLIDAMISKLDGLPASATSDSSSTGETA